MQDHKLDIQISEKTLTPLSMAPVSKEIADNPLQMQSPFAL
jgi:hypothetical protein